MKERPIIFNAEMVKAIFDGRKTQTRRALTSHHINLIKFAAHIGECYPLEDMHDGSQSYYLQYCPFGQIGDRLWVRETWCMSVNDDGHPINSSGELTSNECAELFYRSTPPKNLDAKWVPSIHMPRWASRINLEITGIRVERLNDISEADALAEGMDNGTSDAAMAAGWYEKPQRAFQRLWTQIYGEESWSSNPWVWVIEFKQGGAA